MCKSYETERFGSQLVIKLVILCIINSLSNCFLFSLYFCKVQVLSGMEMEKLALDKGVGKYEEKLKEAEFGRELREAPMGPDPLHHNGAPPRKPRTTP